MIARAVPVPRDALLAEYVARAGAHTDAFEVMSPLAIELPEFIEAFYCTWLFRLERGVLALPMRRLARDQEVRALARGEVERFAVWTVVARTQTQILLSAGHTRSWLAVSPKQGGATRLLFGSAVVPGKDGQLSPGMRFLLPLHLVYARFLLRAAERRLRTS